MREQKVEDPVLHAEAPDAVAGASEHKEGCVEDREGNEELLEAGLGGAAEQDQDRHQISRNSEGASYCNSYPVHLVHPFFQDILKLRMKHLQIESLFAEF